MGLLLAQSGKVGATGIPKPMPEQYWDDVAHCETHGNWQDPGQNAGGIGMNVQAWINYGGRDFAPRPNLATKAEQLQIAYRITVTGYQTKHTYLTLDDRLNNRPFFRPPVGFTGFGCIRAHQYLRPHNWLIAHRKKKHQ